MEQTLITSSKRLIKQIGHNNTYKNYFIFLTVNVLTNKKIDFIQTKSL